jgi:hypothetical protein
MLIRSKHANSNPAQTIIRDQKSGATKQERAGRKAKPNEIRPINPTCYKKGFTHIAPGAEPESPKPSAQIPLTP